MITESPAKLIRETPTDCYEGGCCALFLRVSNEWGIKFYRDKYNRDYAYKYQKRAARFGLAPQVGSKFSVRLPRTHALGRYVRYGFVTECAKETIKARLRRANPYITYSETEHFMKQNEEYNHLMDQLERIGINTFDMHGSNVAYMDDGRMVAIDFV